MLLDRCKFPKNMQLQCKKRGGIGKRDKKDEEYLLNAKKYDQIATCPKEAKSNENISSGQRKTMKKTKKNEEAWEEDEEEEVGEKSYHREYKHLNERKNSLHPDFPPASDTVPGFNLLNNQID